MAAHSAGSGASPAPHFDFPASCPVDISARPVFDRAYLNTPPSVSDLAFNTLFGWQLYFGYRYTRIGGQLFVFYERGKTVTILPPLLLSGALPDPGWEPSFVDAVTRLSSWARSKGMIAEFQYFSADYTRRLSSGRFTFTPERDCADYVYRRSDLVGLSGSDYSAKRNLIRQFTRQYPLRYEPLTAANCGEAGRFIDGWQEQQKDENGILGSGAYCMACRLLQNFNALSLCGGLLFVDNKIVAATIGSLVTDFICPDGKRTAAVIVHHENALTEYKGAYQAINQQFCAHLPETVEFINREEDLGIPGLRKAKLSYRPAFLIEKSRIWYNESIHR